MNIYHPFSNRTKVQAVGADPSSAIMAMDAIGSSCGSHENNTGSVDGDRQKGGDEVGEAVQVTHEVILRGICLNDLQSPHLFLPTPKTGIKSLKQSVLGQQNPTGEH